MAPMRLRRYVILGGVVLALVGLYAAIGFLGVPKLLRSQLTSFTQEKYGRPATVREIHFNPFTLTLVVRDFSFPDADGQPLCSLGRLLVNLDISSIWRRGASFREIVLEKPFARVLIRESGALNLADLAKPFESQSAEPPRQGSPTRLFIDRLEVSAGYATFEDRTHASPFKAQLTPVSFELRDFSTTGKTGNAYELHAQSATGERLDWSGTFGLNPLTSRGRFQFTNLQAHTLWSYVRDSVAFEVASGVIGFDGNYELSAHETATQITATVHQLAVSDLSVKPRDLDTDYVNLTSIKVADARLDVAKQQVSVGKVEIAGGTVRGWRDESGQINLLQLAGPVSPERGAAEVNESEPAVAQANVPVIAQTDQPASTSADKPASPWTFSAPDISLTALSVQLEDRQARPTAALKLDPFNLRVAGFSTAPGTSVEVTTDMRVNEHGRLDAQAKVTPESGALTARVESSTLDLTLLQPYLNQYTRMSLLSGTLSTRLDIDRAAGGTLGIKGNIEVAKLRTVDNALRKDFIKWDLLRAEGIEYSSEPARLRIRTIATRAPYARVIIAPDQTVNLTQVLSAESPAQAAAPSPTPASMSAPTSEPAPVPAAAAPTSKGGDLQVSVGTVRIANGSANFADFWIQPNYAVSIQGLDGTIVGLSSDPKSRARMKLDGKVDRYAPAHISGEVNLLSASLYTDIKMSFKGVEMTSVTPYSGRFAGYKIEKGKLSVDLSYHVENRQLTADQRFVIDQLQLGERVESPDAIKLPLRLAVALLKDSNGVIDIGLPITGSLDDPQFRLGPIIWKAVLGLMRKIVTAPFALLGRLFGGGEEMNLVDFQPGDATLDPAAQEKLAALMKSLKERPQLQLDVPMTFSPDLDRPVLQQRQLREKLLALAQQSGSRSKRRDTPVDETMLSDPSRRFDLLLAQYRLDSGKDAALPPLATAVESTRRKKVEPTELEAANVELEQALYAKHPVSDAELEELGSLRAHAVQDALLGGGEIDPSRVFVINSGGKPGTGDKVRLEMSLK